MAPEFQHANPGDSPSVMWDADTWNAVLDATRAHQANLLGATGTPALGFASLPSLLIHVENCTGGNLTANSPVRLDIESCTINLDFRRRPCYKAKAPTGNGTEVIAILAEPAVGYVTGNASNGTGNGIAKACILGHTIANISVGNTSHRFCDAAANNTLQLISAAAGNIPILGNVSATGNLTLGILLAGRDTSSASTSVWVKITSDQANNAYSAVITTPNGNLGWADGNTTVSVVGGMSETLANGGRYFATLTGTGNSTLGNRTVYTAASGDNWPKLGTVVSSNGTNPHTVRITDTAANGAYGSFSPTINLTANCPENVHLGNGQEVYILPSPTARAIPSYICIPRFVVGSGAIVTFSANTSISPNARHYVLGGSANVTLTVSDTFVRAFQGVLYSFYNNTASSVLTLGPQIGTIKGGSTIAAGKGGIYWFDGTDWWKVGAT